MRLITDTNILLRCSRGRAWRRVEGLLLRGVDLLTTDRNVDEFVGVLQGVFNLDDAGTTEEVERVLHPFSIIPSYQYDDRAEQAQARLQPAAVTDWPVLAASLALEVPIWSEDKDFFGTGVPVWSTYNIEQVSADAEITNA